MIYGDLNRHPEERGQNTFTVSYRSDGDTCTGAILIFYVGQVTEFCYEPPHWEVIDSVMIDCSDLNDGEWQREEFDLEPAYNSQVLMYLYWTGKIPIWVDWFQVGDEPGIGLGTAFQPANDEVRGYVDRYSFGGKSNGILGFHLRGSCGRKPMSFLSTV